MSEGTGVDVDVDVVVVGSINLDLSLQVERFPNPGETVLGSDVLRGGGGKGANQAVAAARLGRHVAMIGCLGDDDAGDYLLRLLEEERVDVSGIDRREGIASGLAVIEVDSAGENRIVVASGANAQVSTDHLAAAEAAIAAAPVVLAQLEVPVSVVEHLASMPRQGLLVLNPAPAVDAIDLSGVDILVPNRGELAGLTGGGAEAVDTDSLVDQVRALPDGPDAVVVTLGGDGALVVEGLRSESVSVDNIAPVAVTAVDTTAAGDAFCGALADALCLGAEVGEAARWAARVAAVTVTRRGAQSSLPLRSDVLS
jgi:ribokinase